MSSLVCKKSNNSLINRDYSRFFFLADEQQKVTMMRVMKITGTSAWSSGRLARCWRVWLLGFKCILSSLIVLLDPKCFTCLFRLCISLPFERPSPARSLFYHAFGLEGLSCVCLCVHHSQSHFHTCTHERAHARTTQTPGTVAHLISGSDSLSPHFLTCSSKLFLHLPVLRVPLSNILSLSLCHYHPSSSPWLSRLSLSLPSHLHPSSPLQKAHPMCHFLYNNEAYVDIRWVKSLSVFKKSKTKWNHSQLIQQLMVSFCIYIKLSRLWCKGDKPQNTGCFFAEIAYVIFTCESVVTFLISINSNEIQAMPNSWW